MIKTENVSVLDHVLALLVELDLRYKMLLAEMDLRYQQRFDAQTRALDAALLAAEKAVQTALTAAEKAVSKAEVATERRIEGLNELRSIVNDISKLQMPRAEAEQRLTALSEKIEEVKSSASAKIEEVKAIAGTQRDRGLGLNAGWAYLIGGVALLGGIITVVLRLTGKSG
jgi:chromosome segregation ATPase